MKYGRRFLNFLFILNDCEDINFKMVKYVNKFMMYFS